jgi:hypothetical protein
MRRHIGKRPRILKFNSPATGGVGERDRNSIFATGRCLRVAVFKSDETGIAGQSGPNDSPDRWLAGYRANLAFALIEQESATAAQQTYDWHQSARTELNLEIHFNLARKFAAA